MKSIKAKIGSNGRLVIKNSIYSMMGLVLGQVVALLSSLVIGRMLGVKGLGSYTFAMTFSGIVYIFLNFGLGGIFERNISQDRNIAEKIYANALALRLIISIPSSLVLGVLCALIMQRGRDIGMLLLACIYTGLTGVFSISIGGISATERFKVTFIFTILQKIICFAVTVGALLMTKSMLVMLLFQDIAFIALIICALIYVEKNICHIRFELDYSYCKKLVSESFPTIFGAAAEYLCLKSDVLVLTLMLGEYATGLYSVSSNVYIAASFVPLAMAKAATPTFNRMISEKKNADRLVKSTLFAMTVSSIVLIIGIVLLGEWGIVLIWGEDFVDAAKSLIILSIGLLFMPANRFFEYLLVGLNKQKTVAKCSVIGAVINILANVILVPIIGMNAVAYTTVITELCIMVMEYLYYKKWTLKACEYYC